MVSDGLSWIFWISAVVAYVFAFGIGANDVANSFGTSVGSGALTMGQAIIVASIFEVTGAVTLGAGVRTVQVFELGSTTLDFDGVLNMYICCVPLVFDNSLQQIYGARC